MKQTSPLWFRKLRVREDGEFAMLPLYVRGLWAQLFKFCDDQGRFPLAGMTPAEAVALRCGAHRYERRMLERDLDMLIKVGALRYDGKALFVVEQEEDWQEWEAMGASTRRRYLNDGATTERVSSRNCSGSIRQQEERRREEEKKQKEIRSEGVQGEGIPKTDPTPSLLGEQFEASLKRKASLGIDESSENGDIIAKDSTHPTPMPAPPSPRVPFAGAHGARPEPFVPVVDPEPVQGQTFPRNEHQSGALTLVTSDTQPKRRRAPSKKAVQPISASQAEAVPLPADWKPNESHYTNGKAEFGYEKKHVDYLAREMRERAETEGWVQKNWDGKFRTWLRKAFEFRKGVLPIVPDPPEPKRRVPLPPPPDPAVVEAADRVAERMKNGESFDVITMINGIGWKLPPVPPIPAE